MNKNLKQEIKTYQNLIKKKAEQKYINCQMDRVIETIKEELIEKIGKIINCSKCNGKAEIWVPGVGTTACPDCDEGYCVDGDWGQRLKEIINLIKQE